MTDHLSSSITHLINQKTVESIAQSIMPNTTHRPLLKALEQHFPDYQFHLMTVTDTHWYSIDGRLIDAEGETIAPSWRTWLTDQFESHGHDVMATFNSVKARGYRYTGHTGCYLYVAVKTGELAQDFIQFEIELYLKEEIQNTLFAGDAPYFRDSLNDLFDCAEERDYSHERVEIPDSKQYGKVRMTNTAQHLSLALECHEKKLQHNIDTLTFNVEHDPNGMFSQQTRMDDGSGQYSYLQVCPDAREYEIGYKRLFDDWNKSSAGQSGATFFEHWYLQFKDNEKYRRPDQFRELYAIPGWCSRKKLPRIEVKAKDTPYSVMDRLTKFDQKIGHPFAWYFFMLHGNRVKSDVGEFIANAVKRGEIHLASEDETILLKWSNTPYGF